MNNCLYKQRFLFGLLLLGLLPEFAFTLVQLCRIFTTHKLMFAVIAWSAIIGAIIHQYFLGRIPGFETFEHELTHAIAALFFFRKIHQFIVTRYRGGCVRYSGKLGGFVADDFIGFAPYMLPTLTLIAILARPLLPNNLFPWFDVFVGLTYGVHSQSMVRGIKRSWGYDYFQSAGSNKIVQSDLAKRGLIYSSVYIFSLTIALHGVMVALLLYGYNGLAVWWNMGWSALSLLGSKLFF